MITLVIPTRNRPDFLGRALSYYAERGFGHPVMVADSSDEEHLRQNQSLLGSLRGGLLGTQEAFAGDTPVLTKLSRTLEKVQTPYVAFGSDDDFFVPEALEKGVRFLETHSDFSVAHGEAVLFGLRSGTTHGEMAWMKPYPQRTIAQETGSERLLEHLSCYTSTWYSVHRTDLLKDSLRQAAPLDLDYFFLEMVPSCLDLIQGKAMRMEGLYMARQSHPGTTSSDGTGSSFDPFAWVAGSEWARQYQRFEACLANALAGKDRIGLDEAKGVLKEGFWSYLVRILSTRWENRYGRSQPRPPSPIRQAALAVPGLPDLWRRARRATYPPPFMPIHQAVTNG